MLPGKVPEGLADEGLTGGVGVGAVLAQQPAQMALGQESPPDVHQRGLRLPGQLLHRPE